MALGVRLLGLIIILGSAWDAFTTFRGVAEFFDLVTQPKLNPAQFAFAFVTTGVIFGFVIASHLIWSFKSDDFPAVILKVAWGICVVVDAYTCWIGTRHFVFYDDDGEPSRASALMLITFLIVASSILMSRLLLAKDVRGKPFLF